MENVLTTTCLLLTMVLFTACSSTASLTNPCDVLVHMTPSESTASHIIATDRPFAQQVAQHRGRYAKYRCG